MDSKQLEARQKGIGGSDVAAIMGLNPWRTPLEVYYSKVLKLSQQDIEDNDKDERCKRGRIAEKNILDNYMADCDCQVMTGLPTFVHPNYDFLIGNVDAIRIDQDDQNDKDNRPVVIECKTVGGYPDQWQGEIPLHYKTQCAHYAMLTNAKRVDLAAMFDRWTFRIFVYERDTKFEAQILNACIDFWQNFVMAKNPPPMLRVEDEKFANFAMAKKDSVMTTNPEITSKIIQIKDLQAQQKALLEEENQAKVVLMNYMQAHEILTDEEGQPLVTWKTTTQKRLDTTKLKEEQPTLYQHYTKTSNYRMLKIK